MTAPQHDAEATKRQASTAALASKDATGKSSGNLDSRNMESVASSSNSSSTTRQKVQRCWFVTLGLLGGFGFVTSQMSFAFAETDFLIVDHSSDAGEIAAEQATSASYTEAESVVDHSQTPYSVAASDLSLEQPTKQSAFQTVGPNQVVPNQIADSIPEAFIEQPTVPVETARTLPATVSATPVALAEQSQHSAQQQPVSADVPAVPTFTAAASVAAPVAHPAAIAPNPELNAEGSNIEGNDAQANETEIAPAAASAGITPTVSPVAPPAFTQPQKPISRRASARPLPSMEGFMETSAIAAPLTVYSHAQASLNQGTLVANFVSNQLLTDAEPVALAMVDEPTLEAPVVAEPVAAEPVAAEPAPVAAPAPAVPEILPAPASVAPAPAAPTPATPPIVEIAPAAETPIVQPTEIVPASLPEGSNLPEEYNSIFIDPTDYSVGATETPTTEAPSVVISEQSTGCEFTVEQGGGVPNGACGTASGSPDAGNTVAEGGYNAPAAANLPEWQAPPVANKPVASAPATNAPVSYNPSGIQLSTSAAGRAYLNRTVRPLVNLQAAEQFIFPLAVPSPITSLFGFRIHPIHGDWRFHAGTDIGAEQGTPVLAAQDGVVDAAEYAGGYGLLVVLQHETDDVKLESRYAHLAEIFVEPGNEVKKGDIIGLVGSTGDSTGPHLHFELRQMTADGWALVNADGLVQASLANLVKALNNPMQTLSFNFSDFNLSNLRTGGSLKAPNSSSEIPTFPGNSGIPFRPAQPNAS